ncbi:MAG: ribonuclease HI, partial [Clostridia bacterium]|nr:ribonuclease HI [Clostridia bacterium]
MELTAVIEALKKLNQKCDVTIHTDSKYVADAFLQGWIWNWMKKGWKKSDGKPVLNPELWKILISEINKHEYKIVWVKGHAGHPENERCDVLATTQAAKYSK